MATAVDRVRDDPVDGRIVRPAPNRVAIALLHGQVETMFVQPAQRLARATEFLDLVEDERDRLLNAPVRVLLISVIRLHEADRRGDDQFARRALA